MFVLQITTSKYPFSIFKLLWQVKEKTQFLMKNSLLDVIVVDTTFQNDIPRPYFIISIVTCVNQR